MITDPQVDDGYARFEPLGAGEIAELLRTHEIGRVAWQGAAGLVVLPVAYAAAGDLVAFRTAPGTALADLAEPTPAVLQLDEFDVETGTGWSVLVRGTTAEVTDRVASAHWRTRLPAPWAPGPRDLTIVLHVTEATGRVVVRP